MTPHSFLYRIFSPVFACCLMMVGTSVGWAGDRSVIIIEGVPEPLPTSPPPRDDLVPHADLKSENPAGLSVDILPSDDLNVGHEIAFRISTRRSGYLILLDINAEGQLSQIFPNVASIARYGTIAASTNLIKPGDAVRIPDFRNPLANFTFKAAPPRGSGVIVAVLSESPIQTLELPQLPANPATPQAWVNHLSGVIRGMKIVSAADPNQIAPGAWSFAAKPYVIK